MKEIITVPIQLESYDAIFNEIDCRPLNIRTVNENIDALLKSGMISLDVCGHQILFLIKKMKTTFFIGHHLTMIIQMEKKVFTKVVQKILNTLPNQKFFIVNRIVVSLIQRFTKKMGYTTCSLKVKRILLKICCSKPIK